MGLDLDELYITYSRGGVMKIDILKDALWWVNSALNNEDFDNSADYARTKSCKEEMEKYIKAFPELEAENAKLKARETELVKGPDMDAVGLGAEPSYRALWDRNKVLEAQIANIKEGLKRLTTLITINPDTVISAVNVDDTGMIGLFNHDIEVATGKDFVGLIDHLLTQERCYE